MEYSVLILGGTSEARALASALVARGIAVVSSLAGRVARPRLPAGEVKIGGFGGPEGLAAWLAERRVRAVVDATHPFAERISTSAVAATQAAGVPLLRLQRPGWQARADADWRWADSLDDAALMLPSLGSRVFLTSGRQGLAAFAHLRDTWFLIRCVDPPHEPLPPHREIVLDRGPYTVDGERALLRDHRIEVLVTKDSGGTMTAAKLDAATELAIPIVVIRRPPAPQAPAAVTVAQAEQWVTERLAASE